MSQLAKRKFNKYINENNEWVFVEIEESYNDLSKTNSKLYRFVEIKEEKEPHGTVVVTGNNNTVLNHSPLSFDLNADNSNKMPTTSNKVDWPLRLKIIAGIVAIAFAVLKGCGVI